MELRYLWDKVQATDTSNYIKKYVKKGDYVLDYGTGKGYIAEDIEKLGCKVERIDIQTLTHDNTPVTLFDGLHIPFPDKYFDTSLCNFVLHHTISHEIILDELSRVTKGNIIICEDLPESSLDKLLAWMHTKASIIRYHSKEMQFYTDSKWKELFLKNKFALVAEDPISRSKRNVFYPIHRKVYVIQR